MVIRTGVHKRLRPDRQTTGPPASGPCPPPDHQPPPCRHGMTRPRWRSTTGPRNRWTIGRRPQSHSTSPKLNQSGSLSPRYFANAFFFLWSRELGNDHSESHGASQKFDERKFDSSLVKEAVPRGQVFTGRRTVNPDKRHNLDPCVFGAGDATIFGPRVKGTDYSQRSRCELGLNSCGSPSLWYLDAERPLFSCG